MRMYRLFGSVIAACVVTAAAACTPVRPPESTAVQVAAVRATDTSWITRSAIYEVFVRDFSPTGDFQGLINGLDRIEAVGANVVWLMPIHPVGVLKRKEPLGSSYSVTDYRAINPEYGTEADFRELVSAVHARGMKLILDWVPNHTAWDHVWVTKYPDRYTRDANGNMTEPLNPDGTSTGWTDVADLDYSNAGTRSGMIADMRYWLETFDIDGFRADVAHSVPYDFWREAITELRAVKPVLLLAEAGEHEMHNLGFDLTYAWESYHKLKAVWKGEPASSFVTHAVQDSRAMPAGGLRLRFTTNHDETAWDAPPVQLFGSAAGARAAFVAMALLPGRPLLYNGQEVESPQTLGLFVKEPVAWDQPEATTARDFYKRVIELTRTHQAFIGTVLSPVSTDVPNDVIAYQRGGVVVLVNTRAQPTQARVSTLAITGARDLLSGGMQQGDTVRLAPHGAVVLELTR
jgi:glycosidase